MRIFLMILALLGSTIASAAIPTDAAEYTLNRLPGQSAARKYALGTMIRESYGDAICVWDYAKTGGAVGDLSLYQTDGLTLCTLPAKSIVRNVKLDTITTASSLGPATLAFYVKTAGDLFAARNVASSYTQLDGIPAGTASTFIKLTTAASVKLTVATSALVAGKVRMFISYSQSE